MKLGFLSSIFGSRSFEETIDFAGDHGFACVELACWPSAGRPGPSHIDVAGISDEKIAYIRDYCSRRNVEISSLGYYPNMLDGDLEKRKYHREHLLHVIRASAKLGIGLVTTFIGRDQWLSLEDNLAQVEEQWRPVISLASDLNVRIGIENCPMFHSPEHWPGGRNLMTTPANWRKVFEILKSPIIGINFDPSHFVWQMMDYVAPIYEFRDRLFHLHLKDVKIYQDKLNAVGIMACPIDYMAPKLPGLGDIDWGRFVSALTDIGYDGCACIEVEDESFEGSDEKINRSLVLSKRYMEQFVI